MSEQILYDLIVNEEWQQPPQVLNEVENYFWQHRGSLLTKLWKLTHGSVAFMLKKLSTQFRYQTSFGCPPYYLINLVNHSLSWSIALTNNGRYVALLQSDVVEIRSSNHNFGKTIALCKVGEDNLPQWRRLAWDDNHYVMAYANSFGEIQLFDLTGTLKCTIKQISKKGLNVPGTLSQAITFMRFTVSDDKNWDSILYTVNHQGYMKCFYIKESGKYEEKFSFSFTSYHPYGVASVIFDLQNNLFVVAGNYGKEPSLVGDTPCYGSHCAISVWRLLSDTPHLTIVEDRGNAVKKLTNKDFLKRFVPIGRKPTEESLTHGIYMIRLSPESSTLVSLHLDGRIALWNFPSMKLKETWHKSEQPGFDKFSFDSKQGKEFLSNVIDINWWSEKELLLSVGNGALTISSAETLENLLGDSPERFDYWPTLSQTVDGHVLVLECEQVITEDGGGSSGGTSDKSIAKSKQWLSEHDDDEEDEGSIRTRLKEIIKQTLYFITEAERFLPAIQPTRVLTNTYRLVSLKSTTPEELFYRKIELEHYGEALDLAFRFNLNTDLIYQRQWRKTPVTKISIHDFLTKIKDRYWVLDECLLRIPDDFDAAEQLLKYGLLGTSWKIVQAIDDIKKEDDTTFIFEENSQEDIDEDEEIEKIKSFTKLSPKQQRLCRYRWQLLHYLDRLSTYEVILGGSFKARDKFDAQFFSTFRSCNIVRQAIEYARNEDSIALEHIFSYHGKQVLPHWLPILANFPETTNVRDFEPVVPEIGEVPEDPEILPWLEKHHRDEDWVENEHILEQIKNELDLEESGEFIYESQAELNEFRDCQSKHVLIAWFKWRIHQIDEESFLVDKCCQVADLAIKRGLEGLKELSNELEILYILTYKVNIDHPLSLKEFLTLTHLSKMKLLMSKSTETSFVTDYKTYVTPFLTSIGKKAGNLKTSLLHEFLVDIAKSDLTCCLKLFERCAPEMSEPLIADMGELMKLAIDCIYACKRDDQLNLAFSIVECLPSREEGVISSRIEELHTGLDELELLLSAAEILEFYKHPQTITYVQSIKKNKKEIENVLRILIKNTATKPKQATPSEWNTLLKHLIKLVKEVYTVVDTKTCHQMLAEGLLQSEVKQNFQLAGELLATSRDAGKSNQKKQVHLTSATNVLKFDVSTEIVVEAAKEYFNSAATLSDPVMELSKCCLSLMVEKTLAIQEEYDFIESLKLLYEFNVTMLPLQVRLCSDKLEIIEMCLKDRDTNYKKADKLLRVGNLLRICGVDMKERNGKIRIKIAESAFLNKDYEFTANQCYHLIEDGFQHAWKICRQLGECEVYTNYATREEMLCFALTYCPIYHIEEILNVKTLLQTKILYEKMSVRIQSGENIGDEDDNNGGNDEQDGLSQSLLKKTTHRTKQLLSGVRDARWVNDAMQWMKSTVQQQQNRSDEEIHQLKYHPFYQSLSNEKQHSSTLKDLSELFDVLRCDKSEEEIFNHLLLRSQKLSERRAEGSLVEDTDEALLSLSKDSYKHDSLETLAYTLSLSEPSVAQTLFNDQRKNIFTFLIASYYCALQLYAEQQKLAKKQIASIYFNSPKVLLNHVLQCCYKDEDLWKTDGGKGLKTYLTALSDLLQAKILKDLDKGVDIERFTIDNEYKKETILGLAMNVEDNLMNTCISLADNYDIALWEVMLSHVEHLFTDSGLKAKEIREQLNKWKIESLLKEHSTEVFDRLKSCVYPEIDGKNHNMLLLFYVFLLNCTSTEHKLQFWILGAEDIGKLEVAQMSWLSCILNLPLHDHIRNMDLGLSNSIFNCGDLLEKSMFQEVDVKFQGNLTLDAHAKLLKKIKAAAPSLNYKELVHGDSPMDVLKSCVKENNVHLLAKIASKIPQKDGSYMQPSDIFLAYVMQSFWESDRNTEKSDWLHHFETCQKVLPKLSIQSIKTFADHIIFSQQSFDLLTQQVRIEIVKRLLKYTRQQKGNGETKLKGSDELAKSMDDYNEVIKYFEVSLKHLKCLESQSYTDLLLSEKESQRRFAKRFDLSKGDEDQMKLLTTDMFLSLEKPEHVTSLITSSEVNISINGCLQNAIQRMLDEVHSTGDLTSFTALINNLKSYFKNGGTEISEDDVLTVVRPFCSDVNVDMKLKSTVLHILQDVFKLSGSELSLLLFYQTDAIISSRWKIQVNQIDVETEESRFCLFCRIIEETVNQEQLDGLEQLLLAWPSLDLEDSSVEKKPWIKLLQKRIELKQVENILFTIKNALSAKELNEKEILIIFDKLKELSVLPSYKLLLLSENKACYDKLFKDLVNKKNLIVDDEFVTLLLNSNMLHRLANTPMFDTLVNFVIQLNDDVINERVLRSLKERELDYEAGCFMMKVDESHSMFRTLSNALTYLKIK